VGLRLASGQPDSRVAVVSYSDSAEVHCGLTPARNTKVIRKAIDSIDLCGSTNIKAGLSKAAKILSSAVGARQVVLLSDGFNTGSDPVPRAKRLGLKQVAR
jgi:Mg-chelatase subunit ChlD